MDWISGSRCWRACSSRQRQETAKCSIWESWPSFYTIIWHTFVTIWLNAVSCFFRYYRLLTDNHPTALNMTPDTPNNIPLPLSDLAIKIRDKLQSVYDKYVDGNVGEKLKNIEVWFQNSNFQLVDYSALSADKDWGDYVTLTHQLQRVDMLQCTRKQV